MSDGKKCPHLTSPETYLSLGEKHTYKETSDHHDPKARHRFKCTEFRPIFGTIFPFFASTWNE
jgi:hypothetical protein